MAYELRPDTGIVPLIDELENSNDIYAIGAASRLSYLYSLAGRNELTDKQREAARLLVESFTSDTPYAEAVDAAVGQTGTAVIYYDALYSVDARLTVSE